jgi:putative ABC transport system permease protein
MPAWLRELRYAARVLWKIGRRRSSPSFTLALAIGATTALFTVVDATLVRALPFPEADLLAVALIAALRPALRAARIDPARALRGD